MEKRRKKCFVQKRVSAGGMILFMLLLLMVTCPVTAKKKKTLPRPALVKSSCTYTYNKARLKWKKVKGAKKYEIQRAKINAKTGKTGKWKKWVLTKKTSIAKKTTGDFKYRIRALNGKKKGKWSKAVRLFAANGKITDMGYTPADIFFGVKLGGEILEMRVLVSNKTDSPMGFVKSGTRIPIQYSIYAINKSTGKKMKKWDAYLDTGKNDIGYASYAKQVNARKKASVYFYAFVTDSEWAKYKNCRFMITASFYPNPTVEPMNTQMAIACTNSVKKSAIAGK